MWFGRGSGVVQVRPRCVCARVGTPTAANVSATWLSLVAPQWFRRGSGVVQAWFRCGSDVERNAKSEHDVPHAFPKGGPLMAQAWFMCGSGVVPVRPRCVLPWGGTPVASIVPSTCRSMVAGLWFRCGSGVVQAWFRRGSDEGLNVKCNHNVFHALFKDGSIAAQVWFTCGSGVVQVRPSCV